MSKTPPHPMQPLVVVDGKVRFKENKLIRWLMKRGGLDLNHVFGSGCDQADLDQFYQLIGYTVSGYDELVGSDVISEKAAIAAAHAMCKQFDTKYCRCLDEEGCPVHGKKKERP